VDDSELEAIILILEREMELRTGETQMELTSSDDDATVESQDGLLSPAQEGKKTSSM